MPAIDGLGVVITSSSLLYRFSSPLVFSQAASDEAFLPVYHFRAQSMSPEMNFKVGMGSVGVELLFRRFCLYSRLKYEV